VYQVLWEIIRLVTVIWPGAAVRKMHEVYLDKNSSTGREWPDAAYNVLGFLLFLAVFSVAISIASVRTE
jgi:hypothetical protein